MLRSALREPGDHPPAARRRYVVCFSSVLPREILAESKALFHDVRPEDVDPETHAEFVIARVLDRGTLRSVGALLRFYGQDRIRDFFRAGGAERLSPRTPPLWIAYLELTPEECTSRSSPRRSATHSISRTSR